MLKVAAVEGLIISFKRRDSQYYFLEEGCTCIEQLLEQFLPFTFPLSFPRNIKVSTLARTHRYAARARAPAGAAQHQQGKKEGKRICVQPPDLAEQFRDK